jgi:hypothetical protein
MTEPGSITPPQPGWWVRSNRIGVAASEYGWAATAAGIYAPQGAASSDYGWAATSVTGRTPAPVTYVNSASGTNVVNVAIPTHQVGDMIVIFAMDGHATNIPAPPAASGSVPAWVTIDANAGANTCAARTVYFVAQATNTTSGNWGDTDALVVAVLRSTGIMSIGGHAEAGGLCNLTSPGPTAPAVTMAHTDGTSQLLHFYGLRVGNWNNFSPTPPSGYTIRTATGASTWCGVLLDTKNSTTSDGAVSHPSLDGLGSHAYRGATVEVRSQ